jgi:hypothetical protein
MMGLDRSRGVANLTLVGRTNAGVMGVMGGCRGCGVEGTEMGERRMGEFGCEGLAKGLGFGLMRRLGLMRMLGAVGELALELGWGWRAEGLAVGSGRARLSTAMGAA